MVRITRSFETFTAASGAVRNGAPGPPATGFRRAAHAESSSGEAPRKSLRERVMSDYKDAPSYNGACLPKKKFRPSHTTFAPQPETPSVSTAPLLVFLERHALAVAACLIGIACVRIAATWNVFANTGDEPSHVASGIEYLADRVYRL